MTQNGAADAVLASALAALPLGVWAFGPDLRLAFANPATEQVTGLPATALQPGTPLGELVRNCAYRGLYGHGDPETLAAEHLRIDRTRPVRRRLRRTDGACFEQVAMPLPEGGFVSAMLEVTGYLAATEEAQAQARQLENLLSRLHGGVAAYNQGRSLLFTNPAYEDLLGLPRGAIRPGMAYDAFFRMLADRGEFSNQDPEAVVADRIRLDRSRPITYQRVRPNGQVLRFESQPLPEGGHLVEVIDITAARRAEDEAQRRAALIDGVLASLPHGVVVYGADGRVAMVNAAHQAIMAGAEVRIGEHRAEIARRRAEQREYGPGDPAELARQHLNAPPHHLAPTQRTRPNGTVLDIRYAPLPDGGTVQVTTDITALHAARAEATAHAAMLQVMLDNMRHGIALYGPDRRLAAANRLAMELSGAPDETVAFGMTLEEIVRTQYRAGAFGTGPAAEAEMARFIDYDRSRPIRYQRALHDGRITEIHSDPTPDGGFVLTWTDVTARARAEAAAGQRAAMLQLALDSMRHGFVLYDAEARLVTANALGASYSSLAPEDLVPGRPLAEVLAKQRDAGAFGPEPEATARLKSLVALDRRQPYEYRRNMPDGRIVEVRSAPTADGGFVVTQTDITALARAEATARERANLLQAMLDNMRHGIVVFGPDQRVVVANDLCGTLAGMPQGAVRPGRGLEELARERVACNGPQDPAAAQAEIDAALAKDRRLPHRRERMNIDGRTVDVASDPLPDGGFVISYVDTTEVNAARAEAQHRATLLQTMQDSMRHGIALFGPDQRLIVANRLAAGLAGLPDTELVPGMTPTEVAQLQLRRGVFGEGPGAEAEARAVAQRDRSRSYPVRRRMPDGRVVDSVSDPTPDGGFVLTWTDVTALVEAETAAAQRATTLQAALDNMRHGLLIYGADRRLKAANALAAELSGLVPEDVAPGTTLDELVRRQHAAGRFGPEPEATQMMQRLIKADRSRRGRRTRHLADGRLVEVFTDPTPDGGFVISFTDITARARAEEEAKRRAAMLRDALDSMRHALILFGPDGRLLTANRLVGPGYGLPDLRDRDGITFEAMVREQHAQGRLGEGSEADARMRELLGQDRRQPLRYRRRMSDGTVIEVGSDPTPDGGFVITHTDVTELAQAQDEATARATILQLMLDNMRHGIAQFDRDKRLVTANRLAAEFNGIEPGLLLPGVHARDLALASLRAGMITPDAVQAGLEDDYSRPHRRIRIRPDGRVIEIFTDPTPDGGFVATYSDITALTEAEAAARQRAGVLQVMLDSMRHGICYYGPDRRVIAANALAAELGGYPQEMLATGVSLDELIASQLRLGSVGGDAEQTAVMARSLDRSRPARYIRPNADGRVIEVTSDPTPDGGFVVTMTDISALARAEAEAQHRAGVLQAMLDNIRHGIALFDWDGLIQAVNPVFLALLDLPEDIMTTGGSFAGVIDHLQARGEYGPGEEGQAVAAGLKARDRRQALRTVRMRPNGVVLESTSEPVPGGGFVLALTDVTEDRRIRAELERAKDAAETANKAKSRFLATMSHELRTPLNAVIGFSEAITADPDPVRGKEYVRSIHEAGRHLLSLIDDILDVTRAETTGFATSEGEVEVIPLVESTVRVMQATAATAGVTVQAELPPALPLLRADELRLRQVLLNLASNAVKFTPQGGLVTVSAAEEADGSLVLRVTDSGIGMKAEDIPRAFEPFSQLDSSLSRRFPGSGLGLYLSRALAEAQGATLTLESVPGAGTTAILRFPKSRLLTSLAA